MQRLALTALLTIAVPITGCENAPKASQSGEGDLTFAGYECTQDCSGHEAGYAWAEENNITDPDDCGGNSQSFIEGCMAYAE